jgi:hypothetical protein
MKKCHYHPDLAEKESEYVDQRRAALPKNLELEKKAPLAGLALSGGGIRSATFCLGVLQALARKGVLPKFDFLSTISGGGYIGSFLGSMFTRHDATEVTSKLTDPQSPELSYLRENGRYLSPNGGGGGLLIAAVYLRNWAGLHFTFGSFVLFVFLCFNLVRFVLLDGKLKPLEDELLKRSISTLWWSPWLLLPMVVAFLWIIPAAWAYWNSQFAFGMKRRWQGVSTVIGSLFVAVFAGWILYTAGAPLPAPIDQYFNRPEVRYWGGLAVVVTFIICMVMWIGAAIGATRKNQPTPNTSADAISLIRTAHVRNVLSNWLRLGITVAAVTAGLGLIDSFGQTLYALMRQDSEQPWFKLVLAGTGLAGTMALVFKFKGIVGLLTGGGGESKWTLPLKTVANAAGYILLLVTLIFWCWVGHAIAYAGGTPQKGLPGSLLLKQSFPPQPSVTLTEEMLIRVQPLGSVSQEVYDPDLWKTEKPNKKVLVFWFCLMLIVSSSAGWSSQFLNLSALQTFYGARIRRAYLGAANPKRHESFSIERNDGADDMPFSSYKPWEKGGPLHLIGTTLNETVSGRSQVVDMDRKGLGLSVGPAGMIGGIEHAALWLEPDSKSVQRIAIKPLQTPHGDYHMFDADHPDRKKNQVVEAMSLANWVSVSGAAFSTGMGANTRSGLAVLLAFFNIRLGYFWDSYIDPWWRKQALSRTSWLQWMWEWMSTNCPVHSHLFFETFGRFHGPNRRLWYLSDGGHFENTGCYELIRRRVPFILCCDCGADPQYTTEDMANLVRKARIDFQAEVTFADEDTIKKLGLTPGQDSPAVIGTLEQLKASKAHATLAFVRYDGGEKDETCILFIKPTVTGDEPLDIQHYNTTHKDFPQETTLDQFFDEAQWESYRKLGEHIGEKVMAVQSTAGWSPTSCTMP